MRKGKDLIGKQIVAYDSGEKIDTIKDLIFDQNENRLVGFLIKEAGWFSNAQILPICSVEALGNDTLVVPSKDAISSSIDRTNIHKVLQDERVLDKMPIVTTDGRDLGRLIDFYFDEQTGIIEGYEVSGGIFADADSGRSFVPATQAIEIGKEVAFVSAATVGSMTQIGGSKAALQTTNRSEKVTATTSDIQGRSIDALEQKRIRAALGRPTIRVILDRDDEVILDVGDLINHRAIDSARSAGTLDLLLDSAYTQTPQLSIGHIK